MSDAGDAVGNKLADTLTSELQEKLKKRIKAIFNKMLISFFGSHKQKNTIQSITDNTVDKAKETTKNIKEATEEALEPSNRITMKFKTQEELAQAEKAFAAHGIPTFQIANSTQPTFSILREDFNRATGSDPSLANSLYPIQARLENAIEQAGLEPSFEKFKQALANEGVKLNVDNKWQNGAPPSQQEFTYSLEDGTEPLKHSQLSESLQNKLPTPQKFPKKAITEHAQKGIRSLISEALKSSKDASFARDQAARQASQGLGQWITHKINKTVTKGDL